MFFDKMVPSKWVIRWASLIQQGGRVLDLACGNGRHSIFLASLGFDVVAIDRDEQKLTNFSQFKKITPICSDLEKRPWPLSDDKFNGIIITNYLHRPLLPHIVRALDKPGVLIYETFGEGNEAFGKPTNKDFLLLRNELFNTLSETLHIVSFEQGYVVNPKKAIVQRVCAIFNDNSMNIQLDREG